MTNGKPKKALSDPVVGLLSGRVAVAEMVGMVSTFSTLVRFCAICLGMDGGIRLVKYCASCPGMFAMANKFPSGPSSVGFSVAVTVGRTGGKMLPPLMVITGVPGLTPV